MHAEIWLEIPKERNYTEGIGVDATTILKLILRNKTATAWTRLPCLKTVDSGRLMWIREWNL